jgi:hypothetical protein
MTRKPDPKADLLDEKPERARKRVLAASVWGAFIVILLIIVTSVVSRM